MRRELPVVQLSYRNTVYLGSSRRLVGTPYAVLNAARVD